MDATRFEKVKSTLLEAIAQPIDVRANFLDEACRGDEALRAEVESLLAEEERPVSVVDRGVVGTEGLAGVFGAYGSMDSPVSGVEAEGTPEKVLNRELVEAPPGPTVGSRVKQFLLQRELGQGGMGQIFLARDTKLGRPVALKFLRIHSKDRVERFLAEARATAQCHHPNIVVIYEASEAMGLPYLALEYLDGMPLTESLREGPLSPEQAVALVLPVARALVAAHARGVVHRDLKPDNILLTQDGQVKVLDFGIAKLFERDDLLNESFEDMEAFAGPGPAITRNGEFLGTVPYMSPEQWGADEVDHRTDLWALGILFWHLLTLRHPISRPVPARLRAALRKLDEPMPTISRAAPELPDGLAEVVDACLLKRKSDRMASAEQLVSRLEALGLPSFNPQSKSAQVDPPRTGALRRRRGEGSISDAVGPLRAGPSSLADSVRLPWFLRVSATRAWAAAFVAGWVLLGLSLGFGVGTSFVDSINWGPNFIIVIPLLAAACAQVLQTSGDALQTVAGSGMLVDATGRFVSENPAFHRWRSTVASKLAGVILLLSLAVSVSEWEQRYRGSPIPGEWWSDSFVVGAVGSVAQGLIFALMVFTGIVAVALTTALWELAKGRFGLRLVVNDHVDDGRGGFGCFQGFIEAVLAVTSLHFVALWASHIQGIALQVGGQNGPVPLGELLTSGSVFAVGPAHYSTRMTTVALVTTAFLCFTTIYGLHRVYWDAGEETGIGQPRSPWLVPGVRLRGLAMALLVMVLSFVFFKLAPFVIVALCVYAGARASRALSPNPPRMS